jgi:TRAP-type C4-dicarboxylate transport system permease small subunit
METSAPEKRDFFLFRWIDHTSELGGFVGTVCMLVVTLIIVFEVVMRYIFSSPTTWVGEMSIYMSMGIGFFGLAYALKDDGHFSITLLVDRLSPRNRLRLKVFTDFVAMLYSCIFIYKGLALAYFSYDIEDVSTGLMEVPLWIPNMLVPIGGLLLALQFINKLADDFKALKKL